MPPKDVERMANSVDPDQTAPVCSDIYVQIFRIFTVVILFIFKIHIACLATVL